MDLDCGHITHRGLTLFSDQRLKTNVTPITDALQTVLGLQGVAFDWIQDTDDGGKRNLGFVAQDVAKVIPDLVTEGRDGLLGIRSDGLAPLLVEALKQQNQKIRELEARVDELAAKLG